MDNTRTGERNNETEKLILMDFYIMKPPQPHSIDAEGGFAHLTSC